MVLNYSCGRMTVRPILIGNVATVLQMICTRSFKHSPGNRIASGLAGERFGYSPTRLARRHGALP